MQVQTQEVGAEKATTATAQCLVSVEQLKQIHHALDACQKVIWLAGCGERGYGFDPAYVTDAQEQLKAIDNVLSGPLAPAWTSVTHRLPECIHECTSSSQLVSDTVLVMDEADSGFSIGFGHLMEDGNWNVYEGEYDFMSPQNVTHWMPLPKAALTQPAQRKEVSHG